MDKPQNCSSHYCVKREGFALLITLSVLAVLMALTGVLLGYFDSVRKDAVATKALIQADLYYTDIKKTITGFKDKKMLFTTLYETSLPLASEDGRFAITLNCQPLSNGVNINWLAYEESDAMAEQYSLAEKVFDRLVEQYEIQDAMRLKELLLQEVRGGGHRFIEKEDSRLLQKNGIISFQQFESVITAYQFEVDDPKIGTVPWKQFFIFRPMTQKIDGNYLSAALISILFDIDLEIVKEEWIEGVTKLKAFVQEYGAVYNKKIFRDKFNEEAVCKVNYTYMGEQFAFTFIDSDGEVKNFEFNGKQ